MGSKHLSTLLVCLVFITAGCSGIGASRTAATQPPAAQVNGTSFKTPEDAVTDYFDGVEQNDLQKILQSCAIDEMGEKFQFDLFTERLGALQPSSSLSPTNSPLFIEINKAQLTAQILNRVKIFSYSLLSGQTIDDSTGVIPMDAASTTNFIKNVDLSRLSGIKLEKIGLPNKTLMESASYIKNASENAHIYGADESTERVALFSFEQGYYYLGFTLLRYGNSWKISAQTSPLAGTSVLGSPKTTTPADFESLINGN